jgi:hypothetical protein
MKKFLAVVVLGMAMALSATRAFAGTSIPHDPPIFYGDGFDNATCMDFPRCR